MGAAIHFRRILEQPSRTGLWPRAVVHGLAVCISWACSDPSSAELPIDVGSLGENPMGTPAASVLELHSESAAGPCPLDIDLALPDSSAVDTLSTGMGDRLRDGDGVDIECQVRRRSSEPDVFDVALRMRRQGLADFRLSGTVQQGAENVLAFSLTLNGTGTFSADCSADASVVVPGAVWLHSVTCQEPSLGMDRLAECTFAGAAIFEDCAR